MLSVLPMAMLVWLFRDHRQVIMRIWIPDQGHTGVSIEVVRAWARQAVAPNLTFPPSDPSQGFHFSCQDQHPSPAEMLSIVAVPKGAQKHPHKPTKNSFWSPPWVQGRSKASPQG